jgi:protease I
MRVAFLATDMVEQVELTEPWAAVEGDGWRPVLISPEEGWIQGAKHFDRGDRFQVDRSVAEACVDEYDALVVPGGVANPDMMRTSPEAVGFVRDFFTQGKPVAVICHGPWMLVEADVVRDRELTSWPSLATDVRNAGGIWRDDEVVVDDGLVTSRKPDDLPAFCAKLVEVFREASDRQPSAAGAQGGERR